MCCARTCSFTRFPFREEAARRYFEALRRELKMIHDLGYQPPSAYIGGGTPTIMMDELERTIDYMRGCSPPLKRFPAKPIPPHLDRERLKADEPYGPAILRWRAEL